MLFLLKTLDTWKDERGLNYLGKFNYTYYLHSTITGHSETNDQVFFVINKLNYDVEILKNSHILPKSLYKKVKPFRDVHWRSTDREIKAIAI